MSFLAKLFGLDSFVAPLISFVVAIGIGAGAYFYIRHLGHEAGYAEAQAVYQDKLDRQAAAAAQANAAEIERQNAANNAAKQREAASLAVLQAENDTLHQKIKELDNESDQAPGGDSIGLDADSVRRINAVR